MDMNTIEAVVPTTDPAQWREGDAWLAGGTVLFSYGSTVLKRLLDLGQAEWPAISVTDAGIELAATCTVAELYALPLSAETASREWPGLALIRPCCDSFVASFKIWNMSTVGGNICTGLPAGPMTSLCAGLDGLATILSPDGSSRNVPVADVVTGDMQTVLAPGELLRSIQLPASALSSPRRFPALVAQQPWSLRRAVDRTARPRRRPGHHRHRVHSAACAAEVPRRAGSRRRDAG